MSLGEDDAVLAAQRAALTKKPPERASVAMEKKRAAREGKNRFARSSVLKIKEVRLWSRAVENTSKAHTYVCTNSLEARGQEQLEYFRQVRQKDATHNTEAEVCSYNEGGSIDDLLL